MSSDSTFKPGDAVQLVSGGPHMTVEDVNEGVYTCLWFDDLRRLRRDDIKELCLTTPFTPNDDQDDQDDDDSEEA